MNEIILLDLPVYPVQNNNINIKQMGFVQSAILSDLGTK
jgi:hypothetical protein